MIKDNNELIITTAEAFDVIKIVNKLNLKDEIFKAIEMFTSMNAKKDNKSEELRKLIIDKIGYEEYISLLDQDKVKVTEEVINENIQFKNEMIELNNKVNSELVKVGMDLLYSFITKMPLAEKEVYKCLAKIYGKKEKEIETQELDILVEQIKGIAQSKTVQGFFKFAM